MEKGAHCKPKQKTARKKDSRLPERKLPPTHLKQGLRRLYGLTSADGIDNSIELGMALSRLRHQLTQVDEDQRPAEYLGYKRRFLQLASAIDRARMNGSWRKEHFNLFDVLGFPYSRMEQIHSNILAWLLDPNESHGKGREFLKRFLAMAFDKPLPEKMVFTVRREVQEQSDRPDIVVEGDRWWLIIENKVDASEGLDQSKRYAERWGSKGVIGTNVFLAWVAPDGSPRPESDKFKFIPYSSVKEIFGTMRWTGESGFLIRHLTEHIKRDLEKK